MIRQRTYMDKRIPPLKLGYRKSHLFVYFTGVWCNGNTADFGSVILSSSLGGSTTKGRVLRLSPLRYPKPPVYQLKRASNLDRQCVMGG